MEIIKSSYNDKTKHYTELNTEIKEYFVYSIKFININYKFINCNNMTIIKNHHDDQCKNCGDFFELVSEIENIIFDQKLINNNQSKKEITAGDHGELIKFDFMDYYILLLCFISYEPNDWSSSPHNNYVIMCSVFNNIEERNECYDKYNDNIYNEYFEHEITNNF